MKRILNVCTTIMTYIIACIVIIVINISAVYCIEAIFAEHAETNTIEVETDVDVPVNPIEVETKSTNDLIEHTKSSYNTQIQQDDEIDMEVWWTDYDLDMLAAIIYYEAGSNECTDRHQQLVGQVVVNRMRDPRFPDTIYDVLTQVDPVQYSTSESVLTNMGNRDIIPQRCYNNALEVLYGRVECPSDVIFQANFKQGTGVYEEHYTSYSTSYFCYG